MSETPNYSSLGIALGVTLVAAGAGLATALGSQSDSQRKSFNESTHKKLNPSSNKELPKKKENEENED